MAPPKPGSGGFIVTREMREILAQPGYLKTRKGGQKLKELYRTQSCSFRATLLNEFAMRCYFADLTYVKTAVVSGDAPDLTGTETPFEFSYATIVVAGAQRVATIDGSPMHHYDVLKFLLSVGAPPDVPDIVGSTALHHATMNNNAKLDLARLLLENGASPNCQDRSGCVPLFGAMQSNQVGAVELLMEFGADVNIPDADGIVPESVCLRWGPQVTAALQKWIRKRNGTEAPMEEKKCDYCGKEGESVKLKRCAACRATWYCSTVCQRAHWKAHMATCRPFSACNTITLTPSYYCDQTVMPLAALMRNLTGISSEEPKCTDANAVIPKPTMQARSMVIKVQAPWNVVACCPVRSPETPLMVYNKKRDFVCWVDRKSDPEAYDRIEDVVRKRGVGGAKGYFPAELVNPGKLVVKVDQILAEQPF
ncbi:hypothetical protein OE88DRAFT_284016 [Heliocybe sulcata]|uniref:MYND-type domain-containing protein n=1 Tax=Heliocybe sulcata TaxID=5364 RepID=A0A5C3NA18_9AGAM|nr:hypothetical protein OE88DRAFT_284016 [Heliocybe sulcata]